MPPPPLCQSKEDNELAPKMALRMEFQARKKQRILAQSTPVSSTANLARETPSISVVLSNSSKYQSLADCLSDKENSFLDSLHGLTSKFNSSVSRMDSEEDEPGEPRDYDDFVKACKQIRNHGMIWERYKPKRENQEGSLYAQTITNPKEVNILAQWFARYAKEKPDTSGPYHIFQFFFDCASFQKFNLQKYFSSTPDVMSIVRTANSSSIINAATDYSKYLFEEKSKLAKIYQYSIFNFLQMFLIEAHQQQILNSPVIKHFLALLRDMCNFATNKPLLHTACLFVLKIMSSLCMIKERQPKSDNASVLDGYVNVLYFCFTKICGIADKSVFKLKEACLYELKIWIGMFPALFLDDFHCSQVIRHLIIDESPTVRIAALNLLLPITEDAHCKEHLRKSGLQALCVQVWKRVQDVDTRVILLALKVFNNLAVHHRDYIPKEDLFENLLKVACHKDFRIGSAAGKCLMDILQSSAMDPKSLLIQLCKLAFSFSNFPILVESCFDHHDLFRNWSVCFGIMNANNPDFKVIEVLSSLMLECVLLTLTGRGSIVRPFSNVSERTVNREHHEDLARHIYPQLKRLIVIYRKYETIITNIFSMLPSINPEYLTTKQCETSGEVIKQASTFLKGWTKTKTLIAFMDYFIYVNDKIPSVDQSIKNKCMGDVKSYISVELQQSFFSKNNYTLLMSRKTAVVFSKVDLNNYILWATLLGSTTILESDIEFMDNILTACHWSLVWKIRTISFNATLADSDRRLEGLDLTREIKMTFDMLKQFYSECFEVMRSKIKNAMFVGFDRICDSSLSLCSELENFSKEVHELDMLKPSYKNNLLLIPEITLILEISVQLKDSISVARFRKHIFQIFHMASLEIIPMECMSTIFKFFDSRYEEYGQIIEAVLLKIQSINEKWLAHLIIDTLVKVHLDIQKETGVVGVKSENVKTLLVLAERFHRTKKLISMKIACRILTLAVSYAISHRCYDFLVYVGAFSSHLKNSSTEIDSILKTLQQMLSNEDKNDPSVLNFIKSLSMVKRNLKEKKTVIGPKSKTDTSQQKSGTLKRKIAKPARKKTYSTQSTTESEVNVSTHDTSTGEHISEMRE
ncbi:cohesin subunit scc-3-like [Euwallacea similis]|uniref:cohesin subunit scc-3-like n=1 Tax=Euwallacea similis TaxID=1736056 RepID=UPI00344CA3CB